ncbi:MAG: hypothetical protein Q9M16_06670 [Mariprofundus sp.]|nr:hypothetical protein [Mariprofundus sp.]
MLKNTSWVVPGNPARSFFAAALNPPPASPAQNIIILLSSYESLAPFTVILNNSTTHARPHHMNKPRWVAMYLSQEMGSKTLSEIAKGFGLKRTGSIPTTVAKLRGLMKEDLNLMEKLNRVKRVFDT